MTQTTVQLIDANAERTGVAQHLDLALRVTDPETVVELLRHSVGDERDRYALGTLRQRLESLLAQNGELELFLKRHLGSDDSTLARTLSARLGDNSPIFKLLSPTESNGLRA